MEYVVFILGLFLVLFFGFGCCVKLLGFPKSLLEWQMSFFELYGLNRVHMFVVGLFELSGILLLSYYLWSQDILFAFLGAGVIFCSSVGALYFHFRYDELKYAYPAIGTVTASGIIALYAFYFLYPHFF